MAFPQDFEVPLDQGGPGQGHHIGGFGGNASKTQDEHRAAVQSSGRAPVILLHGQVGAAESTDWNMLKLKDMLIGAGYPEELTWAPSYLGGPYPPTGNGQPDDGGPNASPHTNNVNEV